MLRRFFAGCFGDDQVGLVTLRKACASCISNDILESNVKLSISTQANTGSHYFLRQNVADEVLPTFHHAAFRGILEHCNGPAAVVACVVEGGPVLIQRGELQFNLPHLRTLWLNVHTGNGSGPDERPLRAYESYLTDLGSLATHDETILTAVEAAARCAANQQYCRIRHRVRLDGAAATTAQTGKGSSAVQCALLEVVSCVLDMGTGKRRPGLVLIIRAPAACPASAGSAFGAANSATEACSATNPPPHPLSLLCPQLPRPRSGASDSIASSNPVVKHRSLLEGPAVRCTTPDVAPDPSRRSQEDAALAGRALAAEALPAMVMAFSFDRCMSGTGSIVYANQLARSYLNIQPATGASGIAGPSGTNGVLPGASGAGLNDLGAGWWRLPPVDVRLLLMEILSGAGLSLDEALQEAAQQQGFSATIKAPAAVDAVALASGRVAARGDGDGEGVGVSTSASQVDNMNRGGGACTARHRLLMNGIAECDEVELQDAIGEEAAAAEGAEDNGEEEDAVYDCREEQTDPRHRTERGETRDCRHPPSLDREASISISERQSTPVLHGGPRPGSFSLVGHVQRQSSTTSSIGVLGTRTESFALPNRIDSSIMNPAVAAGLAVSASASSSYGYGQGHAFGCPPEALRQRLAAAAAAAAAAAVQDEVAEQLLLQRLTKTTVPRQARDVTFQRVPSFHRQTTSPPTMLSALSASSSDRGGADQQQQQQRKKIRSVSSMVPLELHPFASVVGQQRQQWQQQRQQQIATSPVFTPIGGNGDGYSDRDTGPGGGTTVLASPGGGGWMGSPVSVRRHVGSTHVSNEFPSFSLTSKCLRGLPNTQQLLKQTSNIETAPAGAGGPKDATAVAPLLPLYDTRSGTTRGLEGRVRRSLRRVCTVASSELSMRVAALGRGALMPWHPDGNASRPESIIALGTETSTGAVVTSTTASTSCRRLPRSPGLLGEDLGGVSDTPYPLRGGVHGVGISSSHGFCRHPADEPLKPDSGPELHQKEPPDGVIGVKGKVNQLAVCGGCPSAPEPAAGTVSPGAGSRSPTAGPSEFTKSQRQSMPATPLAAGSAEAAMGADCYTAMSGTSCLSPWGLHSSESAQAGSSSMLGEPCGLRGCAAAYSSEAGSVSLLASVPVLSSATGGIRTRTLGVLRTAQHLTTVSSGRSTTEVISRLYGSGAPAMKHDIYREEGGEVDVGKEDDSAPLDSKRTVQLALSLALPQEIFERDALAAATTVVGTAGSGRSTIAPVASPSTNASFPTIGSTLRCDNEMSGHAQAQGQGPAVHCGNNWLPLYPVSAEGAGGQGPSRGPQADTRIDEGQIRQGRNHIRGLRPGLFGIQSQQPSSRADASGVCFAPGSSGGVNDVGAGVRGRGGGAGVHSSSLVSSCWLAPALPTAMSSSGQLADLSLRAAANSVERGGRIFAGAGGGVSINRASVGYHLLMLRGGSTSQHPGLPSGSHLGSTMIDGSIGDLGPGTLPYCRMGAAAAGGGSGGAGGGTCDNSVGGIASTSASATAASFLSTADRSLMNKLVATANTADGSCGADSGRGMEGTGGGGSGSGRAASPAAAVGLALCKTAPWGTSGSRGLTELVTGPSGAISVPKRPASIPRSCSRLHTGPAALGSATSQKRPNSVRTRLCSLLEQMDREDGFGGYGGESPLGGLSPTGAASGGGGTSVGNARGGGTSGITNFMLYANSNADMQGRRASAVLSTAVAPLAAPLPTRRASTTMLEKSTSGVPFSGHLRHMMGREVMQPGAAGPVAGIVPPSRASFCSAASSEFQSGASRLLLQTRASSVGPSNLSYAHHLRDLPNQSHSHVNTNTSDGSLNTTTQSLALHLRLVTSGGCNNQCQQSMQQPSQHLHHHHQQLGCGDSALQVDGVGATDTGTLPGLGLGLGPPDVPRNPTGASMRGDPFNAAGGLCASSPANAMTTAGGASPNWLLSYQMSVSHGGGAPSPTGWAAISCSAGGGLAESPALSRMPMLPTLGEAVERRAALTLPAGPERLMEECVGGPNIGFLNRLGSAGHGAAAAAADASLELRGISSAAVPPEMLSPGSGAASGATSWFRVHLRSFPASDWPVGSQDPAAAGARGRDAAARADGGEGGAGVTTMLLIMQDITVHMTAQERVAALLGHEHKILEALFPRHVIEFMTVVPVGMAAAGVRGRAGGGAKSRVRSRRCFTAAGPASSPQQSANAQASDDGGEGGINMNTGPDTDRGSHPSGDDGGKARGSGSSSSCRRSEWRQLVMQQQLDAIKVSHLATRHKMVTILFSDCVGFTAMCKKVPPLTVMHFLNELYQKLDALLDIYKVYKVETIGDCYVVAGGLVRYDSDGYCSVLPEGEVDELHAVRVMEFGKAMLRASKEVALPTTGEPVQMRLGLHSGPAMSGVVGSKMPRFTVFGETVELAHRMESSGVPNRIHVSGATRELLRKETWEQTEGLLVRKLGKGRQQRGGIDGWLGARVLPKEMR
ncbi:hypothetical protein Vretifemale_14796 [Volvox reticuliferus]|uniref:Guanylate cyclase domain-containing protein n=1 Tax=Volvox reticuliferus TaxID=1737510 RepID=A0A8J4CQH4_9CHLO|nr:hypothetical protein Vretifemale_14796 [Volvox reticuliferus]